MRCEDLDRAIEEVVEGRTLDGDEGAHLASCARCQARLRLARAMNRVLETRELPEPPARFTVGVMARVRRERWRAEQLVDAAFNIAVLLGVALIVAGGAGLAWSFGWLSVDPAFVRLAVDALGRWLEGTMVQMQTVVVAALLLTTALGLWWWVEGEPSF